MAGTMMTREDLQPDGAPPAQEHLLYGTPPLIPIQVKTSKKGPDLTIDLLAHGELFDSERYQSTDATFAVAQAAGEDYVPPIPILQFPLNVGGAAWTWSGTLSSDRDPHPSVARISTSFDKILLGQNPVWAVKAEVNIVIDVHTPDRSAERRLTFWFMKGNGLIQREFGSGSVRKPISQ